MTEKHPSLALVLSNFKHKSAILFSKSSQKIKYLLEFSGSQLCFGCSKLSNSVFFTQHNETNQHEISRRTFSALLKPSQNLYFISRQIHALLSQQTASKPLPSIKFDPLICVHRHALSSVHFLHHVLCLFVVLLVLISLKYCFATLLNN